MKNVINQTIDTDQPVDVLKMNKIGFNAGSDIFSEVLRRGSTLASMEEDNLEGV